MYVRYYNIFVFTFKSQLTFANERLLPRVPYGLKHLLSHICCDLALHENAELVLVRRHQAIVHLVLETSDRTDHAQSRKVSVGKQTGKDKVAVGFVHEVLDVLYRDSVVENKDFYKIKSLYEKYIII